MGSGRAASCLLARWGPPLQPPKTSTARTPAEDAEDASSSSRARGSTPAPRGWPAPRTEAKRTSPRASRRDLVPKASRVCVWDSRTSHRRVVVWERERPNAKAARPFVHPRRRRAPRRRRRRAVSSPPPSPPPSRGASTSPCPPRRETSRRPLRLSERRRVEERRTPCPKPSCVQSPSRRRSRNPSPSQTRGRYCSNPSRAPRRVPP